MILALLRFVNHQLVRDLNEQATSIRLLESRLDTSERHVSQLLAQLAETQRSERAAWQMQVNREWQGLGAPAPFPDAPKLSTPPRNFEQIEDPVSARRPSQQIQEKIREFKQKSREMIGTNAARPS